MWDTLTIRYLPIDLAVRDVPPRTVSLHAVPDDSSRSLPTLTEPSTLTDAPSSILSIPMLEVSG